MAITTVALLASATACGNQGATVGPYPSTTATATHTPGGVIPTPGGGTPTPTATPGGGGGSATPTATPGGGGGSASPTASPTSSGNPVPTPSASSTATSSAIGPLVITPDPINFGVASILGATQTAAISQMNYSGPFTIPANGVVCGNALLGNPVTATISGSTLSVTLGALGVTGSCTITVDGAPGTAPGTETVNLAVPLGTPSSTGKLTFTPNPVDFNVINGVAGSTATSIVSETGYAGTFSLPANPISCPFNLLPLTQLQATLSGDTVTLTTGLLNANLLGSCSVTVDDANGNSGALTVNFQLL